MPQVKYRLAEGQTEAITVGEIIVTATEVTQYVSDEELAAFEGDDRISVERVGTAETS